MNVLTLPTRCRLIPLGVPAMPCSREDHAEAALQFFRLANEAAREAIYWRRRANGHLLSRALAREARLFRCMAQSCLKHELDS